MYSNLFGICWVFQNVLADSVVFIPVPDNPIMIPGLPGKIWIAFTDINSTDPFILINYHPQWAGFLDDFTEGTPNLGVPSGAEQWDLFVTNAPFDDLPFCGDSIIIIPWTWSGMMINESNSTYGKWTGISIHLWHAKDPI